MKPIPLSAARSIARKYGHHQVIVIGRTVDQPGEHAHVPAGTGGDHVTTYGVDPAHCEVVARVGDYLKHKVMQWPREPGIVDLILEDVEIRQKNSEPDDVLVIGHDELRAILLHRVIGVARG